MTLAAAVAGAPRPALGDPPIAIAPLLADPGQLAAWLRDRDPIVDAARARLAAAAAASRQARVLPNPQLSFEAGGFVLGKSTVDDSGADAHLSLRQTTAFTFGASTLVELGKRAPRRDAADLRERAAGEAAVGALGAELGDATTALGKLVYVVARRDVVAQNLDAARRLRDTEQVRLDHQDLSALELARIQLDTDELARQLARAEAEVASALAACGARLAAPCGPAGLDAGALDRAAPLPASAPDADAVLERRPARVASQLEASALGQDATLARNRRIPDLTLGVQYTLDNLVIAGDQHQSLAFTLGIPLPVFDRGDHDAAAARANAHALEAEDRAVIREAHGTVEALVHQRHTLETALAGLEADAVPRSTQIIAQTRKAFDLGELRLADLLLVERAHRDLLMEALDTRFELFNVRAQLRQVLGLDDDVARSLNPIRSHP